MNYHDFPRAERSQFTGIKAGLLTAEHKPAMVGNDGQIYEVPLFDLMTNQASRTISFRCQWAGEGTRTVFLTDLLKVVRV